MRTRWKQFAFAATLAVAMVAAHGQTAGIDPALLVRAYRGDATAQVQIGDCYTAGKGVTQDLIEAAKWYKKAADTGNISGEIHLAALYRDGGKGFPRDMEQAAALYCKAAEQGDVDAQGTLGVLYSIGQGVPQSYVEAYYWLDLAAAVRGPRQEQYSANRQLIGTHITTDELAQVKERVAAWLAAHPRPNDAR